MYVGRAELRSSSGKGDTNDLPVTINADNAKGNYPDDAVFTGNVDIMQGNSRLQADEVQLHQKQAEGQLNLYAPSMRWVMCIMMIIRSSLKGRRAGRT